MDTHRQHPAHPVSVHIIHPREIQALWAHTYDTDTLHCNAVMIILVPPPVSLARLLCRYGPYRDLNPKHQRGVFCGPLGGFKNYEIFNYAFLDQVFH